MLIVNIVTMGFTMNPLFITKKSFSGVFYDRSVRTFKVNESGVSNVQIVCTDVLDYVTTDYGMVVRTSDQKMFLITRFYSYFKDITEKMKILLETECLDTVKFLDLHYRNFLVVNQKTVYRIAIDLYDFNDSTLWNKMEYDEDIIVQCFYGGHIFLRAGDKYYFNDLEVKHDIVKTMTHCSMDNHLFIVDTDSNIHMVSIADNYKTKHLVYRTFKQELEEDEYITRIFSFDEELCLMTNNKRLIKHYCEDLKNDQMLERILLNVHDVKIENNILFTFLDNDIISLDNSYTFHKYKMTGIDRRYMYGFCYWPDNKGLYENEYPFTCIAKDGTVFKDYVDTRCTDTETGDDFIREIKAIPIEYFNDNPLLVKLDNGAKLMKSARSAEQ